MNKERDFFNSIKANRQLQESDDREVHSQQKTFPSHSNSTKNALLEKLVEALGGSVLIVGCPCWCPYWRIWAGNLFCTLILIYEKREASTTTFWKILKSNHVLWKALETSPNEISRENSKSFKSLKGNPKIVWSLPFQRKMNVLMFLDNKVTETFF